MLNDRLEIVIMQVPDRRIGPNRSRYQHWGVTTRLRNDLKHEAALAVLAALNGRRWVPVHEATVDIKIYNGARRMDRDNTIACLKVAFDAMQGKIIVNDSGLRIGSVEWCRDNGPPRTLIVLTPLQ